MSAPKPNEMYELAQVEDLLHGQGLPLTDQRRAIFEDLAGRRDHPTADQIYESILDRFPRVSRTTVYRVLETFVRVGAVRKVDHPGSSSRFDARVDRHHHLICTECEKVEDYVPPKTEKLPLPNARKTGFTVADYSINFTGTCSDCRTA